MRLPDNYPDDIRQYDNDPRSPFYVGDEECCEECYDLGYFCGNCESDCEELRDEEK